jgi:DNA-binding Lrp family transcriptional regulator
VNKYVALLNFSKLGYDVRTHFAISVKHDAKEQVEKFLLNQPHINMLYRVTYLYDFFGEAFFKSKEDEETFFGMLSANFPILDIQKYKTEKELKQQTFLTRPEHVLLQE